MYIFVLTMDILKYKSKDFIIERVSYKKVRIYYNIPVYASIDNIWVFLKYYKMGITVKNFTLNENIILSRDKGYFSYQKILHLISGNFKIKMDCIKQEKGIYNTDFENIIQSFEIIEYFYLKGNKVKERIRKYKIEKMLDL